jgi:hypothetical protein
MKTQLNEIKRMQRLAGILKEGIYLKEDINSLQGGKVEYIRPDEDNPYRKKIVHIDDQGNETVILDGETDQEQQSAISKLLGKGDAIDQMFEPDQFIDVLGYEDMIEFGEAIANAIGADFQG